MSTNIVKQEPRFTGKVMRPWTRNRVWQWFWGWVWRAEWIPIGKWGMAPWVLTQMTGMEGRQFKARPKEMA